MIRPVRIANCSGFYGDRLAAAREMLGGPIDVLTGDYLAELTMLILWKARRKDPGLGYATTFLRQMEDVLGACLERGVKVVANAGGLNPEGLAAKITELSSKLGLPARVAYITGDDLAPVIGDLQAAGQEFVNTDTGLPLAKAGLPVATANAYLGGWGITVALQAGPDRVALTGTRGSPPPDTLKVALNMLGGYCNTTTMVLTGLDIEQKASGAIALLTGLLGGTEQFDEFDVRLLRFDHPDAPTNEQATAHLRVTVKDTEERKVGRAFSDVIWELALGGYAGFHTTGPPTAASAFGVYWPTLVPAALVTQTVHLPDGGTEIVRHYEGSYPASTRPGSVADAEPAGPAGPAGPGVGPHGDVPLGRLCGARSGDKGGDANVGLWATSPRAYAWLCEYLTASRLRDLLTEAAGLPIDRYELPNLLALNFVIHGLLAPGVSATTRPDAQAKGLGEYLRSRLVPAPADLE